MGWMALVRPFRAIRPTRDNARAIASVPYDVVDVDEARALARGNPLSFLHVSRAEIDLGPDVDPHADDVYLSAAERYRRLKQEAPLLLEETPAVYVYRLQARGQSQTGIAACFSLEEYAAGIIKKHERTRRDKEDDRTRHIVELRAQTGPVFLTFRPASSVQMAAMSVLADEPLIDFEADDQVRHTIWRLPQSSANAVIEAFSHVPALYIADGHHRAASGDRARRVLQDSTEANFFLGVAFPADQVRILPYNRVVRGLNGLKSAELMAALERAGVAVRQGSETPERKGQVSMYVDRSWYSLSLDGGNRPPDDVVKSLDCELLQARVLAPILGIGDVRTDPRIDFVGGARGADALVRLVDGGKAAVAFSMFPVSVHELMAVSDAALMMPPKSTWFEPKLRDGLLIHEI
jgi:uncharacterized protein (DUF1015 family)